jgi:hypothetical protein
VGLAEEGLPPHDARGCLGREPAEARQRCFDGGVHYVSHDALGRVVAAGVMPHVAVHEALEDTAEHVGRHGVHFFRLAHAEPKPLEQVVERVTP